MTQDNMKDITSGDSDLGKRGPAKGYKAQRDKEQQEIMLPALEARQRQFKDLVPYQLEDQRAGSIVGRLSMGGQKNDGLSMMQYEAAQRYHSDHAAYLRATGSILPRQPKAMDLNRIHGNSDNPENIGKITRIIRHWTNLKAYLTDAAHQYRNPNLFNALDSFVIRDMDSGPQRGDLRLALNALAKFYAIPGMEEAA